MKSAQTLKWQCISCCGACCRLAPEERLEALEALNETQTMTYMKMVGEDGWCIHLDKSKRLCRIYSDRPDFCRVSNLHRLFQFESSETDSNAIAFCTDQIQSTFGVSSDEYIRFNREVCYSSNNE